jgi:hypothetical protein
MRTTTIEGEPESSKPRERSPSMTAAIKRASGEGVALHAATAPVHVQDHTHEREARVGRFLRHRLTSPEKRTVKRIQAQRVDPFFAARHGMDRPALELKKARILHMLRDDRGLKAGLRSADAYEALATLLVNPALAERSAAEIIGLFLRHVGAMERPKLKAPRVKAALRLLNEVLYGSDQSSAIARSVREFRLEKRDGGIQIVGLLRAGSDEPSVMQACLNVLAKAYRDVDVRLLARK